MPKKDGTIKTFSFGKETMNQIEFLCGEYMLKTTSLIEFLINKEFKNYLAGVNMITEPPYKLPVSLKEDNV